MIINKLRIQEEHPIYGFGADQYPLPIIDLNLDNSAGDNGYILKDAAGLGPPSLTAVIEGFDTYGVPVYNNVADNRYITLKIGFNPQVGQSYSSLRDNFYRLVSRSIYIKLMNDAEIVAQTVGFITNIDPVHFSNKPEIQIDIECRQGDFEGPLYIDIPNASLLTATPVIQYTEGTAPAGLDFAFEVTANHSNFTISSHAGFWHAGNSGVYTDFIATYNFLIGDFVYLNTVPSTRQLLVVRGGSQYDITGFLNAGAIWPKLYTGVNPFDWDLTPSWLNFSRARYIPRFWGV